MTILLMMFLVDIQMHSGILTNMEYWEILLSEWRKKGRDGYSIPFIIGSQQFLDKTSKQNVENLIADIVKNLNNEIYISYCMTINDLIIGIRDDSKKHINGYFPEYNGREQNKFFITSFVSDLGTNIEEVIECLTERYSDRISNKEFSINNRVPGNYSAEEKEFIINCLK